MRDGKVVALNAPTTAEPSSLRVGSAYSMQARTLATALKFDAHVLVNELVQVEDYLLFPRALAPCAALAPCTALALALALAAAFALP